MKKALLTAAVAVAAVCLAIALTLYFDPFSGFFDQLFNGRQADDSGFNAEFTIYYEEKAEALPDEAVALLKSYFADFYGALGGSNKNTSLGSLYGYNCAHYRFDDLAIYGAQAYREAMGADLGFSKCQVKLKILSSASTDTGYLAVRLTQSVKIFYDFLPDGLSSESGIITHDFMLKMSSGKWQIYSHDADGGLWTYSKGLFEQLSLPDGYYAKELTEDKLEAYWDRACRLAKKQAQANAELLSSNAGAPVAAAQTPYDRDAAVKYAVQWAAGDREVRNLNQYDSYDNDSANFVSQCLAAGGMNPDLSGSDNKSLWKWYDGEQDYSETAVGCTRSWYECDAFYRYCNGNISGGIAAVPNVRSDLLEEGDVVQFMETDPVTGESAPAFEGIITAVIDGENGSRDFLIAAHSPELLNVPLSAVPCDGLRFIKIAGGA